MTLMNDEHQAERDRLRPVLHELRATPKTVHWGYFDAALAPVLTVANGDIVRAEAMTHHAGDAPELMMDEGVTRHLQRDPAGGPQPRRPPHDRPDLRRGRAAGRHAGGALSADDAAAALRLQPRGALGPSLQGVRREGARDDLSPG